MGVSCESKGRAAPLALAVDSSSSDSVAKDYTKTSTSTCSANDDALFSVGVGLPSSPTSRYPAVRWLTSSRSSRSLPKRIALVFIVCVCLALAIKQSIDELAYRRLHQFQSITEYQSVLESFIRRAFPPADSQDDDPHSLINAMRSHFMATPGSPPIPKNIFQTATTRDDYDSMVSKTSSWITLNPDHKIIFHDDQRANEWVRSRFSRVEEGRISMVEEAWTALGTHGVFRADLWRYLVLAVEGGVYCDTDVEALKPIDTWALDPSWNGQLPLDYQSPSLIVAVESSERLSRPVQITQWTIAATRGHPVLIDMVRKVVEYGTSELRKEEELLNINSIIMERTGPAIFTDTVLQYLLTRYSVRWTAIKNLGDDGLRVGDTKILRDIGFNSRIPHPASSDGASMAYHHYRGSWKTDDKRFPVYSEEAVAQERSHMSIK